MLPIRHHLMGQEFIPSSQQLNTDTQGATTSENDKSPDQGNFTESFQNQVVFPDCYGNDPQDLVASTPFQSMYDQGQSTFSRHHPMYGPALPAYGSDQASQGHGAVFEYQGNFGYQEELNSPNQTALNHQEATHSPNYEPLTLHEGAHPSSQAAYDSQYLSYGQGQVASGPSSALQVISPRGRLLRNILQTPPNLSRPQRNTLQHSPPRRPYHEAMAASPVAASGFPTPSSEQQLTREEFYEQRIATLEITKKLTLNTLKAYDTEIGALEADLTKGWALETANSNLALLYSADVRLTDLRKLSETGLNYFRRLEHEIEATWEDFLIPGEARSKEERDFEEGL